MQDEFIPRNVRTHPRVPEVVKPESPGVDAAEPAPPMAKTPARRVFLPVRRTTIIADRVFRWTMLACALSVIAIVALIVF